MDPGPGHNPQAALARRQCRLTPGCASGSRSSLPGARGHPLEEETTHNNTAELGQKCREEDQSGTYRLPGWQPGRSRPPNAEVSAAFSSTWYNYLPTPVARYMTKLGERQISDLYTPAASAHACL